MTVGFYHAGLDSELAAAMVASVRTHMAGVEVVQMTDINSLIVPGVDRVQAFDAGPIAHAVIEHYAACEGDWLFLDTDVLVRADVRHVFDQPFDIAVATREGTLKPDEVGTKFMASMPFNKGVVFSRSQMFWQEALAWLNDRPTKDHAWMGDQKAVNAVIASGAFAVRVLPAAFNYPPKRRREDVSGQHVLHFKGPRKAWMLERA